MRMVVEQVGRCVLRLGLDDRVARDVGVALRDGSVGDVRAAAERRTELDDRVPVSLGPPHPRGHARLRLLRRRGGHLSAADTDERYSTKNFFTPPPSVARRYRAA